MILNEIKEFFAKVEVKMLLFGSDSKDQLWSTKESLQEQENLTLMTNDICLLQTVNNYT